MTQPTAIVSGCARGIGAAGVRDMAQRGWKLALLDRDEAVRDVATEVDAVHFSVVDAGDTAALEAAVRRAMDALGGADAVWSNAGVQISGGIEAVTTEQWEQSWAVNLRAHALLARVTVPALRASPGSFVLTASNSGLLAEAEMVAYSVTKAAAIALVRSHPRPRVVWYSVQRPVPGLCGHRVQRTDLVAGGRSGPVPQPGRHDDSVGSDGQRRGDRSPRRMAAD
jgi:NAD(P)-dependent dehydrogenase (short-subunit alcohol dehydrogenase family)